MDPSPATALLLVLTLSLSSPVLSVTWPADVSALKALKLAVEPASIAAGSCLSSWDFERDPCDSAFTDHFTCGLRCDAREPVSGFARVTEIALDPAGYSGRLPTSIWSSFPFLESIDLSDNRFSGPIPPPHPSGLPSTLRRIALSRNSFSGEIPPLAPSPSLEELYLDNNFFSGSIPRGIARLKRLELQRNNLSGGIPDLRSLSSLYSMDASDNNLWGRFPAALPQSLVGLSLRNNKLEGCLPSSVISALPWLQVLDLSKNSFSGAVPAAVFQHPSLEQLVLANNEFESMEEPADGGVGSQLIAMDLGHNRLGGMLPGFIGAMPRLRAVTLEANRFAGMIPAEYAVRAAGMGGAGVVPFARLMLAGNYLCGPVPSLMLGGGGVAAAVSLGDNCLFRCPMEFDFCRGAQQKTPATCRDFNPLIP
ncbi:hypothetical protein J5N97_019018 [Dioscorea zingiberensis]|uniref:Uncharacterized protein n=1 Tax=Dioscorea zingiberensis TaxID=325984 RepID=A0A9D5HC35_9LILI|nr:hypothetical protein J5N97_019018 [Dioscorea zingiberensis]